MKAMYSIVVIYNIGLIVSKSLIIIMCYVRTMHRGSLIAVTVAARDGC